jgi:hypothetical protein
MERYVTKAQMLCSLPLENGRARTALTSETGLISRVSPDRSAPGQLGEA